METSEARLDIFKTQELADLFDEMSDEVKKNIVTKGFRKAAKLIIDQTNANLPAATKAASKFSKKLGTMATAGEYSLMVGMKKKGVGNLAHLIENGTVERYYKVRHPVWQYRQKNGTMQRTGKMTGQHFFEAALDSTENDVENSISDFICEAFEKLVAKYEKQSKK